MLLTGEGAVMRRPKETATAGLDALASDYPTWNVWCSDGGHWYAARRGASLTEAQFAAGMFATVDGASRDALLTEVMRQDSAFDRWCEAKAAARAR